MNRKRFDPDDALERAMNVFWAKGFEGTSAQDLVEAMGINRGSLYATFGSKRQLYETALERYLERDRATLARAIGREPLREALGDLLRRYADQLVADPQRRGCFLVNACAEMTPGDGRVADRLSAELDAQQRLIREAITAARSRGEPVAGGGDADLAAFIVGAVQGLRVVGKATGDRERLERIIELTLDTVGGRLLETTADA